MRILALDSALSLCGAGIVVDGALVAGGTARIERGQGGMLAAMAEAALRKADLAATSLDCLAVTVGPGSFTGIRAALALAHGIGLAAGVPVIGVTVGEALAQALPRLGGRALWVAIDSRRARVFLERDGAVESYALDDLPTPRGPLALAGDAAGAVASALAAQGHDVMLTDARAPTPRLVALAAALRAEGALPPRDAQPLYVDPPEARPAAPLRAPVP
jgi:tRNA threonylcarbamoyl adenosine modification protein YeaZ